jgi:hypothetical protein
MQFSHSDARDLAQEAFDQWLRWNPSKREPVIDASRCTDESTKLSMSDACKLVWNDTGIVPGYIVDSLVTEELPIKSRTYAACARAIVRDVREKLAKAIRKAA